MASDAEPTPPSTAPPTGADVEAPDELKPPTPAWWRTYRDARVEAFRKRDWRDLGLKAGAPIGGLLAAIGLAVFIGTLPEWRALARGEEPEAVQAAVAALEASGIPYELGPGGSIFVPDDRMAEARLEVATKVETSGHAVGFELFDQAELGRSSFAEKVNYRRALEGELARTIESLDLVHRARVHLVMPERRLFAEDVVEPTASVTLAMRGGATLGKAQVRGIQHLVSAAVERLESEAVTVTDSEGRMLSEARDVGWEASTLLEANARYQAMRERDLQERVVDLMAPVVGGRDRVRVTVSTQFDFSSLVETEETFDPESQVVRSERERTEDAQRLPSTAQGVPGTGTNLPDNAGMANRQAAGAPSKATKLDHIKNYEIDKTTRRTETPTPRLKRISVGVVLDRNAPVPTSSDEPREWTDEEIDEYRGVIARAVGVDEERGDTIEVAAIPFATPQPVPEPKWEGPFDQWWSPALAYLFTVLGVLLSVFLTRRLRRLRREAEDERQRKVVEAKKAALEAEEAAKETERQRLEEAERQRLEATLPPLHVRIEQLRSRAAGLADKDLLQVVWVLKSWLEEADDRDAKGGGGEDVPADGTERESDA